MLQSTPEIMAKGMSALVKSLGHVEAEKFIYTIKRENFDYTKWRREFFKDMTVDEYLDEAEKYAKLHPYTGNGEIL